MLFLLTIGLGGWGIAISAVAAVCWMIDHPRMGVCVPDDLPHDDILRIARPFLGTFISKPVEWTPLKDRKVFFEGYNDTDLDADDPSLVDELRHAALVEDHLRREGEHAHELGELREGHPGDLFA